MIPEWSPEIAAAQLAALTACQSEARLHDLRLVENPEVTVPERDIPSGADADVAAERYYAARMGWSA